MFFANLTLIAGDETMIFVKAYEYLFLQCYRWSLKINGKNAFTKYHATLMLSLVLLTNMATLVPLIDLTTNLSLLDKVVQLPKLVIVIFLIINFLIHYIYFCHNDRYLKIESKQDLSISKYGQRVLFVYVMFSFVILMSLLMLVAQ